MGSDVETCKHLQQSIYSNVRIPCNRIARIDGFCETHHPQTREAMKAQLKHAEKKKKALQAYEQACLMLGRAIAEDDDPNVVSAIVPVHGDRLKDIRKAQAKLRKLGLTTKE